MLDLFRGYHRPSEEAFKELWANAVFVFDTNVLLNLYSYPDSARDTFFSVLRRVSQRSWIPYQVALEFHRNRFNRIKQANKAVFELTEKVRTASQQLERDFKHIEFEKRNTGIQDVDVRLQNVRQAYAHLEEALNLACKRLPTVRLDDPIGRDVLLIFEGRVGPPPPDQEALDKLISDGPERFEQKIPPGFGDSAKQETYRDRELNYPAKFGDLILWRQLLANIGQDENAQVIFVTGDRKADWWLQESGKVLGPLPELVQEFHLKTKAKNFWMYSADQFLEYASEFLMAEEVTAETIAQVRETADLEHNKSLAEAAEAADSVLRNNWAHWGIADPDENHQSDLRNLIFWSGDQRAGAQQGRSIAIDISPSIWQWILRKHPRANLIKFEQPTYFLEADGAKHAYRIMEASQPARALVRAMIHLAYELLRTNAVQTSSVVMVLPIDSLIISDERRLSKLVSDALEMMQTYPVTTFTVGYISAGSFMEMTSLRSPELK